MAQALGNFFQRNRVSIQDALLRDMEAQTTPSILNARHTCLEWLNTNPEALSTAFAEQFSQQLVHPETFVQQSSGQYAQLQLVDDDVLGRQLAEEKVAARLTDTLRSDLMLLFSRLQSLMHQAQNDPDQTRGFGPREIVHALSRALDSLDLPSASGTLLIQRSADSLCETLRLTYMALNQFLGEQGVDEHIPVRSPHAPAPNRTEPTVGQDILALIQSVAAHGLPPLSTAGPTSANMTPSLGGNSFPGGLPGFHDNLAKWQTQSPPIPDTGTGLRQAQQYARHTDAEHFDRAVLDTLTALFDFILGDPAVSPSYQSAITQLQTPTLQVALESLAFFDDDQHPARQLIDLLGQFSRRFPDTHPACSQALQQAEAVCAQVANDDNQPAEGFTRAQHALSAWLDEENARVRGVLSADIAHLQHIENQQLGTLLALQNLQDLSTRLPAPEAVLQRLEAAWIPFMASLYVTESGEGTHWRDACTTLLQLFQSLQAPAPDAREARLRSIPATNAALRRGLLAQGADPAQLKSFFSAITAAQECWIRPEVSQPAGVTRTFRPQPVSANNGNTLARQLASPDFDDPILRQAQQLHEGDWVDFEPLYQGLAAARVAWIGVGGHLLLCNDSEAQHFSLDCAQLAAEIRAGRARIPEQSLTRRAMLSLKLQIHARIT
jgi:hypothetical protein